MQLFRLSRSRFMPKSGEARGLNCDDFNYRAGDAQLSLF
jgi:hypothetical protein